MIDAAGSPERIGPYHLLRELGSGRFGTVHLAEQHEPVHRLVALKLLRQGLAQSDVLADFSAEREALSLMTHPGIAQLLDAGRTDDGRPFFVLEYVEGPPLHEWIGSHAPGLDERLHLFEQLCGAVQHAHQKGVLHRDLSDRNVLVAATPTGPQVKVIDFGLAHSMATGLVGGAARIGEVTGTHGFMSPEQAAGRNHEIDLRTDVYALGVHLYRLLADRFPLEDAGLGPLEVMRRLQEEDPERPSRAGATTAPATATARAGWDRQVCRDLDWVALHALSRRRDARYGSVADLLADVAQCRRGKAPSVGPPGAGSRLLRALRRHRLLASTLAVVALLLGLAFTVSLDRWLTSRTDAATAAEHAGNAARSEREALAAEQQATELLADFDRLADRVLLDRLLAEEPALWPARPERAAAFTEWLQQARPLAARLDPHRAFAVALAAAVDGGPENRVRRQLLIQALQRLVADLERLTAAGGALELVKRGRAWSGQVTTATVTEHAAAWQRAATAIAGDPRFAGFVLRPQVGLVPLGPDRTSGLQEFYDPATGTAPSRSDDGRLHFARDAALVFVLIPGGPAWLGCQSTDPEGRHYDPQREPDEGPVREVAGSPLLVGKHELSQGQWRAITGLPAEQEHRYWSGADAGWNLRLPVSASFRRVAAALHRLGCRLPTTNEWERAARAGSKQRWAVAEEARLVRHANLLDRAYASRIALAELDPERLPDDGKARLAAVMDQHFLPNDYGLWHTLGNVAEWCSDPVAAGNAAGEPALRVLCGGSHAYLPHQARVTSRWRMREDLRATDVGVRPVRPVR